MYNIKITTLTIFKYTVPWHYVLLHCCATITTIHLQNFFIFPNWRFICIVFWSFFFSPNILSETSSYFAAYSFFNTFISSGCEIFNTDNAHESAYGWTFVLFPVFPFVSDKYLCVCNTSHILDYFLWIASRLKNTNILVIFLNTCWQFFLLYQIYTSIVWYIHPFFQINKDLVNS